MKHLHSNSRGPANVDFIYNADSKEYFCTAFVERFTDGQGSGERGDNATTFEVSCMHCTDADGEDFEYSPSVEQDLIERAIEAYDD